jgi:citrate synthase
MAWLTAAQALQVLAVRPQTLYANVSRGRIRAKPDPKDSRRSLYHEADVRTMSRRHAGRRGSAAVAAAAIEWGDPILSSAVSTVVDGRLYYRGQDAAALSDEKTFEEVAHMLWGAQGVADVPGARTGSFAGKGTSALQRSFLALGLRAATDLSSRGRAPSVLQAEAASVLDTVAEALLDERPAPRPRLAAKAALNERLAASWCRPDVADLARRALILLADHELNASTFATRVAVSTGAPLAAGVLSGLATLSGPLHGRASLGVLELVAGVEQAGAQATVRDWLLQGRPIAGFGHPLYPAGDLRAALLLKDIALPAAYAQLRDVVEDVTGERPNVDFALAALAKVFALPQEAPLILFALGRCAGWLAHALEQVALGQPIRPRARYSGPPVQRSLEPKVPLLRRPVTPTMMR